MDIHLALNGTGPFRAQLERELRAAIRAGRMRAGAKLPPSRALAQQLGVSRGVVVEAYSQLVAEGYLVARTGAGTRVAEGVSARPEQTGMSSAVTTRVRYDLRPGVPDLSLFPRREWQAAMSAATRELPDAALGYGFRGGLAQLRLALGEYLGRVHAVVCDPEQVIIASGAAHALSVLWQALRDRGARRVAVEDPASPAIALTARKAGLQVVPVWVDDEGLDVARLDDMVVDAAVVSPAHQYPTGAVLAPARRGRLVEWARRNRTLIVEYESDADHRYGPDPTASLQGLAPDCVVYLGTAATTLAPAVRLAWTIAPCDLSAQMAAQPDLIHAAPSALLQAAYARLLEHGEIDRHLRRVRRRYLTRRDVLRDALANRLPEAGVRGAALGLHLIAWLPEEADEARIADRAARRGVAVYALHRRCAVSARRPPALVLGYGAIAEPAIPRAIELLADSAWRTGPVVEAQPRSRALVFPRPLACQA
jgi:GntR family transcriptional regulator/MocR family aminotransferase